MERNARGITISAGYVALSTLICFVWEVITMIIFLICL